MQIRAFPLFALVAFQLTASLAYAKIHRDFERRFVVNLHGDIQIVGNTLLSCSTQQDPNREFCDEARQGGEGRNNQFYMDHVDLDENSFTFNSSAADLTLPPNAEVAWAGLYWGARLSDGKFGGVPAQDSALANTVLFGVNREYQEVGAQQVDRFATTYSAFADVTHLVKAQASGSTRTYWTGNVQTGTGGNRHAGWALVVIYKDPAQPLRNLTVFDGYADVRSKASVTTQLTGFATPLTGDFAVRVGAVTYDGDLSLRGDRVQFDGDDIVDLDSSQTNFFNAGIARLGHRITDKQPDFVNQLGVDIDIFDGKSNLKNGQQEVDVTFSSKGDIYYPAVLTLSTEIAHPNLTQNFVTSVVDLNGGHPLPGELLEYRARFENSGGDPAVNSILTAPIPKGTRFEPGSLRIIQDDAAPENIGVYSDLTGDDLAELGGDSVVFRVGVGADHKNGGRIDHPDFPNAGDKPRSVVVSYRVRVLRDVADTFPAVLQNRGRVRFTSLSTTALLDGESQVASIEIQEPPKAQIAVASKATNPKDNLDGSHTISFSAIVKNAGHTDLNAVALHQDLNDIFDGSEFDLVSVAAQQGSLVLAKDFTGKPPHTNLLSEESQLTVGETGEVSIDVTVYAEGNPGPYNAFFSASGRTFFDLVYEDQSTDGVKPDANGDGDATNDQEPTVIVFNSPPVTENDTSVASYGVSIELDVLKNDTDPDRDQLTIVTFENKNPAEFGKLTQNDNGTFVYQAPGIQPESFNGTFEFSYSVADPAGQHSLGVATVTLPTASADLGVSVVADKQSVELGGEITLTVTAHNYGGQDTEPTVTQTLPKGLQVESVETSQGQYDSDTGTWSVGVLPAGDKKAPADANMIVRATVMDANSYLATVAIDAERLTDSKTRNNTAKITPKAVKPDIAVTKSRVSKPQPNAAGGYDISYELTVRNPSRVALQNVQVVSELIAGFASAEDFRVVAVRGDFTPNPEFDGSDHQDLLAGTDALEAGAKGSLIMVVNVNPGANPGPYTQTATLSAESHHGIGVTTETEFGEVVFVQ